MLIGKEKTFHEGVLYNKHRMVVYLFVKELIRYISAESNNNVR